ncbi:MAG: TonB-dependent receptor, partial [Ferruginibacter sp.]
MSCCSTVWAQLQFKGIVVNENHTPIESVTLTVNQQVKAVSAQNGQFQCTFPFNKVVVTFSHIGYQSQSVEIIANQFSIIVLTRTNPFLATLEVKAYEYNGALKNIPAAVSVLGKASLERFSNINFVSAINTVAGVKMDERSPGSYRLSIRGNLLRSPFGVRNVKVYWNGIPFTDANGNTYLNQIGFTNVDQMEIIKGPGGSMYGAGTGGVLLLTNKSTVGNSITLNTVVASYGTLESSIQLKLADSGSYQSLQYAHAQSDGWRQQTAMRRDNLQYTNTFQINKKQTIRTQLFYSDFYYQTPGGLTLLQQQQNARQARPASGIFPGAKDQRAAIYLKTIYAGFGHTYTFNSRWISTTGIYTAHTQFKNPSILNFQRKTELGFGGRSVFQYQHNHVTVHLGGELQHSFTSTQTYANKFGTPDTLQFNDEIAANLWNVFTQAEFKLKGNIVLQTGLSFNNASYGLTRLKTRPILMAQRKFAPIVVPRLSVLKHFSDWFTLYANLSKGFSPPTIDEIMASTGIFNTQLEAEQALNIELGTRLVVLPNTLFAEFNYYVLQLNNTIVTRRDAAGADYFVNAGTTMQRGFEGTINYYPLQRQNGFVRSIKCWNSVS